MHLGATSPQTEIGVDPTAIGDYARGAGPSPEAIGIDGRILYGLYEMGDPVQWIETALLSLHAGLAGLSAHIDALGRSIEVMAGSGL